MVNTMQYGVEGESKMAKKYERVPLRFRTKKQAESFCKDLNKTSRKWSYTYRKQANKAWGQQYQIYKYVK